MSDGPKHIPERERGRAVAGQRGNPNVKSVLRNTSLVFLYIILGMVSYVLLTQVHVIGEFILGSALLVAAQ